MSTGSAARFLLLALLLLLALFPPESRGESLAGCALLIALLPLAVGPTLPGTSLLGGLCLMAVAACPLVLVSSAPGTGVGPASMTFLGLLVGIYAGAIPDETRRHPAFGWVLAGAATAASVHGLVQVLGGLSRTARALKEVAIPDREAVLARLQGGRAFAGFPTPAALGGFLALALPVTVAIARSSRGRARIAAWCLAVGQVAGLLATRSVTAAAALLAAVVLFLAVRSRRRRGWLTGMGAAAVLLAAVVGLRGGELIGTNRPDHPVRLRAGNARIALEMARDHPWLGVGPGAYGEVYPAYRTHLDNESRHAHNVVLELVAEYGVPLGGVLAGIFLLVFVGPALRPSRDPPGWRTGASVGLAAFAIQNLADFTSFLPSLLWCAAVVRGLIAHPAPPRRLPERVRIPAAFVAGAGVVFALLAAAGGLAWNERVAAREALARGDGRAAEAAARRAVRRAPWDPDGRLVLVRALAEPSGRDGPPEEPAPEAMVHAEAAVRLSPVRAAARQVRGRLRLLGDDRAGAWADLAAAAELNPMRPGYARERDRLRGGLPSSSAPGEEHR